MGNNKSKKEINPIEQILAHTYHNTDIEFSFKEITSFKLRIHDAENYFHVKFDFFFYFNNYLFRERLSIFYDNYNTKIEKFSANQLRPSFSVLIDFDDESENISRGLKMDFDSLYTIIFERLEISVILFFDMTGVDVDYIGEFFDQLLESVDLYKYNRKFDCMYFLLPSTDYFIKNDFSILYLSNKTIHNKKLFFNEEMLSIDDEFYEAIFIKPETQEKFLNSRYPVNEANHFIEYFLEKIKPTFCKVCLTINFGTEIETLVINNEDQFKLIELLLQISPINSINIRIDSSINFNIIEVFIKKIMNLFDKSLIEENVLNLKLILKNKKNILSFEFISLKNTIKSLIQDFTIYNIVQNKRKLILELYEINFPIVIQNSNTNRSTVSKNNSLDFNPNPSSECTVMREKLFFYWFDPVQNKLKDFKFCFGVLLKKFEKMKCKKIIYKIKEYLFTNYISKYKKESKIISLEDTYRI